MNIQEFRKRYPQYDDLNDQQLATAIHQKFYSDLPQEQVFATLGFVPKPVTPVAPAEPFTMSPEEMVDPEAALVLGAKPFAPTKPAPAPEKPEEPMGYDEALDDAVNYLQEGVPEAQVKRMFEGVEWEDISARARQRGMFVPKVLEEYTPEQVRERVKKYGELKGTPETDFAQDPAKWTAEAFTNVGKRAGANYRDVATSFLVQSGGIDPIDAALTLKENARRRSAAAPSLAIQEGMQEIGASETYGDAVSAMLKNPRATFTMVVDSVATSVPLVAPALVVAPAGFPAAAAAAFVGSAGLEYGSVMADVLQDKGVDLSDTLSIDKALRDPKIMNEIKEKGAKRGLIVGGFDAITMGLSGRFLRPVNELIEAAKLSGDAAKKAAIAAWGKEFAVQTGGGAAGEFLAQKATGEDRPADVLLEALAGGVTAPLEAMSALRGAREIEEGRAPPPVAPKAPTRIEPTLGPVAPATPPITAPAAPPVAAPAAAPVSPPITPEPESAFAELTFDDEEAAPPAAPSAAITPPAPPAPSVQPPAAPTAPPAPSQPPAADPKASPDPTIREASKVLDMTDRLEAREEQDIEGGMIYDENLFVSNAITKEDLDLFQEALKYATFIKENEENFLAGDFIQMSDDVPSLIVNLFSGLEKRNLPYAREKLDYLRGATKDFISRTESYIKEFLPQPTEKPRLELVKTEPPKKERAPKQEKPAGEGPQPLLEEMEIDELEAQRRKIQRSPGQNLLATLRGRLSKEEADDIGTEFKMRTLRRAASKGSPDSLDDIVSNGELDEFLPYDMRSTVPTFDEKDSVEYIKEQIRDNNNLTYETQLALKELDFKIQEAYENLRLVDVNRELQAVAREEKELASEAEAAAIEAEERGAARDQAPPGESAEGVGLDLRGQTPEELAELQRKEESGEADKEREAAERKRAADLEREVFALQPSPAAPPPKQVSGDMFGAADMVDQPARKASSEEPTPIEEAVNEKPTEGDVLLIEADEKDFSRALKNAPTDDPILEELFNTKQAPAKPTATKFLSLKEASNVIDDWKKEAEQQGQTGINSEKTVISLFDASGQWSKPWVDAGFNVVTYDLQTGQDIQKFDAAMLLDEHGNDNVWAILAAPPCTDYASSGAQYWKSKDADGRTKISNELVQQVLRTVELLRPAVWAMENPVGRIAKVNNLPPAQLTFQPNLYGDPYTKKTLLWGNFNNKLPQAPVEPTEGSKIVKISSGNKYERSLTPEGFAYSFFAANNPVNMTQEERLSREFHGISPEEFKGAGTEEEIRDKIQDAYFDNDLDLVRELLKEKTPPGKLLFSIDMFADESSETSPPSIVPPKKLPPGRSRELAEAAAKVKSGEMSALEYDALVNKYKPIPVYDEPMRPASQSEVIDALDKNKRDKVNPDIPDGTPVGLRLDIPAFNRKGVFVVSIHQKRTPSAVGKVIGYGSVAKITDVTFAPGNQKKALDIATGEAKDVLQTMEGKYVNITPEQAYEDAKRAIKDPSYVQVGVDPTRHAYFFDRRTTMPIIGASEVIQIGNMILAKNPVFGRKEQFLFNINQGDLFGESIEPQRPSDKPKPGKKVEKGRSPELAVLAERLKRGEITKSEYDQAVNRFKPIFVYEEVPAPATDKQVVDALDSNKRPRANVDLPDGTKVGLRLDIPAFEKNNTFVVAIHESKPTATSPKAGASLSYRSVAGLKNVKFTVGNQAKALDIAAGEFKDKLQTMEGDYVSLTPEQAFKRAQAALNDPTYIQVGFNPLRHAYFYDRRTTMPVIGASEVIQVGNLILAKNPVYGTKEDFLYDVNTASTIDQPRSAQDEETLQSTREDIIREYAALRRRRTELVKQIKKGQVSIGLQRALTLIDELSREYKEAIEASAERRDSAEAFLARALQEFDKGNIDAEVLAVIQAAYLKAPKLLEGLLLSVKKFKGEGGAAGSFDPFERIVALYKGTSGVRNAGTFLHELAHTLEQMMTPEQRKALIDAWAAAIKKSMRKHLAPDAKDREKFQKFFDAVQKFMDNPTERNKAEAVKLLPGRDFYQFISPSEFWAVNAQSLMAARLGPAWERFKAAIRRLFEGLKKVFGFDNRYDVHQVFKQVAYGDLNRKDYSTIEDMIIDGTYEKKILKNLPDDVDDYMKNYDRPDTPYETSTPVKDAMLGSAQAASQAAKNAATNPLGTASKLIGSVDRGLTAVQNEFVWFGSGLDAADFSRYNGQLRDGYGKLAASAYATQAMHAGHVGTQVINLGRLIFNAKTQLFQAVKDQYSMANVVRLKAEIVKLLGEQRSANLVNTYFEAKRARSIQNEYQRVEANYQNATTPEAKSDLWEELQQIIRAYDKIPSSFLKKDPNGDIAEVDVIGPNNKKISVAIVDDTAIDEAIDFEIRVPQLRDMMTNWTAVNQNMLENMRLAGILSKERYQKLKSIKDYVPWYRVMDDNMDIHEPTGGAVRGLSGVPRERRFGKGRTERAVDDIVDNMLHNVLLLTKSTMRNYANNRIIQNYAARDAKGRVKLAKREGPLPNGSVGVKALINGRRVTVEITDPLVAAASIGMENIDLPVNEIIGTLTNAFRRGITLDPFFQLAQIIKDAPGAAWVTGVRNPLALIGGVFESFVMALNPNDPVTQILKSYGIGGFQSLSRSPERQLKIDIGLLNKSNFARALDVLDRIGDASDFAQRRAIYNRVLKETGDETQALLQANNIIDFMKRGSSRSAQFVSRYVAFATAYAQSINVLAQALAGGGLKGMSRKKAQARILKTGALLAGLSTLYAMSVAGSEEYEELDDQTRLRNIVIPGSKAIFGEAVLIPMNTSAAFFFKALPELTYNKIIRDGTETEMDATRLKKALAEAAADSLLGPNVVPSAIKPAIEVALNKNFWTGSTVIPRGLEKFESAEQYNAATSELAKTFSGLTEVGDKRLLSPIEFDHMIRGMFGTAGYLSMYASNMLAAERPDPRLRDTPGLGRFFAGPVGRKNEELFYDLKERAEKKYQTYQLLAEKRDKQDEAEKYLDKNIGLISAYDYIKDIESDFQDINDLIRQIGESSSYPGTPKEKREEITDLQKLKSEILEGVERERKDAGL